MIPFVDLRAQYEALREELDPAIIDAVRSMTFIKGPQVAIFEDAFSAYCESGYAVGVADGTDALLFAIRALDLPAGSVAYTVPNTFVATAEAASHAGLEVVLADVDPDTWLMTTTTLADHVDDRPGVVVPVHLFGHVVDFEPIETLAKDHGLEIVEDAAQAHGARYRTKRVGSLGRAAGFSFYPGKNLGAYGDAGAVVTSDPDLAERVRVLADHGGSVRYQHDVIGWTSRLDSIQAAILIVKLRHLEDANAKRRGAAAAYHQRLADVDGLLWPRTVSETEPVHHLMVVSVPRRDELRSFLESKSISTGIHYPKPIHLQPAYRHLGYARGDFPVSEHLADTIVSLPMYPEITEQQLDAVCAAVREFYDAV